MSRKAFVVMQHTFLIHIYIWIIFIYFISDQLKDYKLQFELMLEAENQVDNCKQKLALAESKEAKLRKDYKKCLKREHSSDLLDIESQLKQATHARNLAQEEGIFYL